MAEIDKVVRELNIKRKAQFSMIDLYRTLKAWFNLYEYDFFERDYEDSIEKGKKSLSIKWRGQKEVDDYFRYRINVKFSLKDYEIKETKQGKIVEGDLSIRFDGEIQVDWDDRWENRPIQKFLRACFDKFVSIGKRERCEKEIKDECYDILNRTKSYLNMQKFK